MQRTRMTKAQLVSELAELRLRVSELETTQRERQGSEEALQASETRYRRLFETAKDGILILDADTGQIMDVNPFLTDMLGYPHEEFVGKELWEIGPFKDVEASRVAFRELQSSEYIRYEHLPLETSTGRSIDVEFVSNIYRLDGGRVIQCNIRDITERVRRERELESIATIGAGLRNAPTRGDMLPVIVDQVLRLLRAEGAALVMYDPATGESVVVLARGEWTHWTGMRLPPGHEVIGHVFATGRLFVSADAQTDSRIRQPDLFGPVQGVVGVPLIEQGRTIGAIWIGRKTDIGRNELSLLGVIGEIAANALSRAEVLETLESRVEERTRALALANERLKALDRLKDEFISNINHELRTPFTNIKLYLGLLERGNPDKHVIYMETLDREVARLEKIIEDLLDFSRIDRDLTKVELAPINVNQIVDWLIVDRLALATEYGLTLTYAPAASPPLALANPVLLTQVISNFLANAFHYTPPGGTVTVTTAHIQDQARDWAMATVRDTGPGISTEDRLHLFERFYRGEAARKSRAPGTGLGLAICKEIVQRLGGRITVDSEPGHGAAFSVWLPLATEP